MPPWGKFISPWPKLRSSFPVLSKTRIGGSLRPSHELSTHRCTTKISPLGAGSMAVTAAHFTPGGSWPQSRVVR